MTGEEAERVEDGPSLFAKGRLEITYYGSEISAVVDYGSGKSRDLATWLEKHDGHEVIVLLVDLGVEQ